MRSLMTMLRSAKNLNKVGMQTLWNKDKGKLFNAKGRIMVHGKWGRPENSKKEYRKRINADVAQKKINDILEKEIKSVMFDINASKAPGPDGFTAAFVKKAWNIVGYNRKGGPKRVALKIDLQKAYDIINWGFLKRTLEEFGFHEKMVHWIKECVTTAGFTLNVNGERIGYFKGSRGLSQGDPISPCLFTLIMEMFYLMLKRQIERDSSFQYHFGCKQIKLVHVCFADDLLVMCHGDTNSIRVIQRALDEFSECSGLFPNNSMSTVFLAV
nr:RNA-directed DNA polymerase, eukaryota, reverse transcriptase zinc-binding domain protein [Tanacetum cinerariifolium]